MVRRRMSYRSVKLVALLLILLVVTAHVVAGTTPVDKVRMPSLYGYPVKDAAFQGHLPCGNAYMEVRSTKRPDEWVVVWYLNKNVLAIVFVYPGYNQAFVDYDFDGWVNYVDIARTGEGSVADFYKKVKGCGNGVFQ